MKKFLIALSMLAMGITSTQAQVAYEKAKAFDNVYLGVEGGVTGPLNFKHFAPVNPAAGLKLGKQFSPVYGANLEGLAFFGDNRWQTGSLGFSNSHTVVRAINLGLNGTINFTNLFCEYNPDRRFEVGAEAGIGYWITYGDKHIIQTNNVGDDTELTAKTGLTFAYNLGEKRAWQLYVEPAVLWNLTHGPGDAVQFIDNLVFVTFAQGKYFLTNEAKKALDDVKAGRHVQIVGTASPEGPKALNDRLSQNRADVVAKYLQSRGVIVDEAKGQGVQGVTSNRLAVVYVK